MNRPFVRVGEEDLGLSAGSGELELPEARCVVGIRGRSGLKECEAQRLTFLSQVHGARVIRDPRGGEEADAMIVRRGRGVPALRVADCLPVLAATEGSLAAAHAGWRGMAAGIVRSLFESLFDGVQAVVLGPAICGECYRVGPEVMESMAGLTDTAAHPRGRLDLVRAAMDQLEEAGLPPGVPVYHLDVCTLCGRGLYSYRGGDRNRRNHIWIEEL